MEIKNICILGHYNPELKRNKILIYGLKFLGIKISEIDSLYLNSRIALAGKGYHRKFWFNLLPKIFLENISLFKNAVFNLNKIKNCDLILLPSYSNYNVLTGKFFAVLFGKKIALDAHGSIYFLRIITSQDYPQKSFYAKIILLIDKIGIFLCDKYLTFSESYKEELEKITNSKRGKIVSVYTGSEEVYKIINTKKKSGVFMFGSFKKFHGFDKAILCANEVYKKNKDIVFYFSGNGPEKENCQNLIKKLNVKNVIFLGFLERSCFENVIKNSKIILGPLGGTDKNDLEISTKMCEAASFGKALIVVKARGVKEIFKNGQSAIFCENNNPEEIAEKILSLYNNEYLLEKIEKGISEVYKKNLSPMVIAQKFIKEFF